MKKKLLFIPILAGMLITSCGEAPSAPIVPNGITINEHSLKMEVEETFQLSATVTPDNAPDKTVTWSVSKGSEFVSVTSDGVVTANAIGNATVTATTVNGLVDNCFITITGKSILPTSMVINEDSVVIKPDESHSLTTTILPTNATDKSISWSILFGNDVVSINKYGTVVGIRDGNAVVEAKTVNGLTDTCEIVVATVIVDPTSVHLDKTSATMTVNSTLQLNATVLPTDATDKSVTWSVTNGSDYISVSSSGLVTAKAIGTGVAKVETINGLSATCTITVSSAPVLPTSITLDKTSLDLPLNWTHTFKVTVLPENATDKTVTYSVIAGADCISLDGNVVTPIKLGSAVVKASTVNSEVYTTCNIIVRPEVPTEITGYVTDRGGVFTGNPYQLVDDQFVEVTDYEIVDGMKAYTFKYNTTIKFMMQDHEFAVPLGARVNNVDYAIADDNSVSFESVVEDPYEELFFFLQIDSLYFEDIPSTGEYDIELNPSAHLDIQIFNENMGRVISVDVNDLIYIKITSTSEDYKLKQLTGNTINSDMGTKVNFEFTKIEENLYSMKVPYSYSQLLKFYVTEVNASLFRDSPLVGDYLVIRTYGLSGSDSYIKDFEKTNNDYVKVTFTEAGEIIYKNYVTYASSASDGVINAMFGTSSIQLFYGENILILGMNSSGGQVITPLSQGSTDLVICVKVPVGITYSSIELDNKVMKIDNVSYGSFNFYTQNGTPIASCYIDASSNSILMNTGVIMFSEGGVKADKAVFDVTNSDDLVIKSFGYVEEGGAGNYRILTRVNGYVNLDHDLVFINDEQAMFDDELFAVKDDGDNVELSIPTRKIVISFDDTTMTFAIVSDEPITPEELDIANKTFKGRAWNEWDECYNDVTVTFGPSNTEITGTYFEKQHVTYYWTFTGVYDPSTSIITITVIDRGYDGHTSNFDTSIGRNARCFVEGNTIKWLDNISTQTNVHASKNVVLTLVA